MRNKYVVGITLDWSPENDHPKTPVRLFLGDARQWNAAFRGRNNLPGALELYYVVPIRGGKIEGIELIGNEGSTIDDEYLKSFIDPQIIVSTYDAMSGSVKSFVDAVNMGDDRFWTPLHSSKMPPDSKEKEVTPESATEFIEKWKEGINKGAGKFAAGVDPDTVEYPPLEVVFSRIAGDSESIVKGRLVERIVTGDYRLDADPKEMLVGNTVAAAHFHIVDTECFDTSEGIAVLNASGELFMFPDVGDSTKDLQDQLLQKLLASMTIRKSWRSFEVTLPKALIR